MSTRTITLLKNKIFMLPPSFMRKGANHLVVPTCMFRFLEEDSLVGKRTFHEPSTLGLVHMGSQHLSPKYDMDAYMATLFGGEAWRRGHMTQK